VKPQAKKKKKKKGGLASKHAQHRSKIVHMAEYGTLMHHGRPRSELVDSTQIVQVDPSEVLDCLHHIVHCASASEYHVYIWVVGIVVPVRACRQILEAKTMKR